MHPVRARTTSRNPVWRLLLVGLAFTRSVVNLYITLRRTFVVGASTDYNPTTNLPISLDRLATTLRQTVELLLGSQPALICRQPVVLS